MYISSLQASVRSTTRGFAGRPAAAWPAASLPLSARRPPERASSQAPVRQRPNLEAPRQRMLISAIGLPSGNLTSLLKMVD